MSDPQWLRQVFIDVQEDLAHDLTRASRNVDHPTMKGDVHESRWIELLRHYLPKRYAVDTGQVIDSKGARSKQIDVIIYDPQYTPLLHVQQRLKYVPIEAVYAIFECKPEINKATVEYAGERIASVRRLHRTSIAIEHAGGTFPAKKLFNIIGGILAAKAGWDNNLESDSFASSLPTAALHQLDCGCALSGGAFNHNDGKLEITRGETNLMGFLFKLLSALQTLATVPAIDWQAYSQVLEK